LADWPLQDWGGIGEQDWGGIGEGGRGGGAGGRWRQSFWGAYMRMAVCIRAAWHQSFRYVD